MANFKELNEFALASREYDILREQYDEIPWEVKYARDPSDEIEVLAKKLDDAFLRYVLWWWMDWLT